MLYYVEKMTLMSTCDDFVMTIVRQDAFELDAMIAKMAKEYLNVTCDIDMLKVVSCPLYADDVDDTADADHIYADVAVADDAILMDSTTN
jgi:hypothetical protein